MPDIDTMNLGSISGIIAITFVFVEILKAYITPSTPILGKIPTWMFPIFISCGLAIFANKVVIINGQPLLVGNTWILLGRAFLAGMSASGAYSMIKNRTTSIGCSEPLASTQPTKIKKIKEIKKPKEIQKPKGKHK